MRERAAAVLGNQLVDGVRRTQRLTVPQDDDGRLLRMFICVAEELVTARDRSAKRSRVRAASLVANCLVRDHPLDVWFALDEHEKRAFDANERDQQSRTE